MRLLLDTPIFLWAVSGSKRLKPPVRRTIEAADKVYVSAASIWEVAIKARHGKLDADAQQLAAMIEVSGFVERPVRAAHAAEVARLTQHHDDPFDRILFDQSIAEPVRLLTADARLARYGDLTLVV